MGQYLSADEVLDAIKRFSKTPAGRDEIKEHTHRKRSTFIPKWWDPKMVFRTVKQMYRAAEDMANILYRHIIEDTIPEGGVGIDANGERYELVGLSEFRREDIVVHHPKHITEDQWGCNISIRKEALKRKSLVPGEQLDDVVALFVHGYTNARASAHGEWHGHEIHTKRDKPGNDFMQRAVDEFNNKYKDKAIATLKDDYK